MIIRKIKTIVEYKACEEIQKAVWQFADREIVPRNELIAVQRSGGLVAGAFEKKTKKLIGFCFGFPGIWNNEIIHCSRMLAVLPRLQMKNIGFKLKLYQRRFCLQIGVRKIHWTFDPLISKNAYFNLAKLGARGIRYYKNYYGSDATSIFNRGLDTDRILVEWNISDFHSKSSSKALRLDNTPVINRTFYKKDGLLEISSSNLILNNRFLLFEIPYDFMELKLRDLELAKLWRQSSRQALSRYFDRGYRPTGFVVNGEKKSGAYILEKE
jgi:predicted GNAT superfamily acetyltransferase